MLPEVARGHLVVAAAARVGVHVLPVAHDTCPWMSGAAVSARDGSGRAQSVADRVAAGERACPSTRWPGYRLLGALGAAKSPGATGRARRPSATGAMAIRARPRCWMPAQQEQLRRHWPVRPRTMGSGRAAGGGLDEPDLDEGERAARLGVDAPPRVHAATARAPARPGPIQPPRRRSKRGAYRADRRGEAAHPHATITLWAEDEHRLGLLPLVRRIWAPQGQRPAPAWSATTSGSTSTASCARRPAGVGGVCSPRDNTGLGPRPGHLRAR